jgi:hypothetical protein
MVARRLEICHSTDKIYLAKNASTLPAATVHWHPERTHNAGTYVFRVSNVPCAVGTQSLQATPGRYKLHPARTDFQRGRGGGLCIGNYFGDNKKDTLVDGILDGVCLYNVALGTDRVFQVAQEGIN